MMRNKDRFVDIGFARQIKHGETFSGDTFLSKKFNEEARIITVLSDGLGSGIKASVLSTITATMSLRFAQLNRDLRETAMTIATTLPLCSVRKISYATFTIIDIASDFKVNVVEYDNPELIVFKGSEFQQIPMKKVKIDMPDRDAAYLRFYTYNLSLDDRIIVCSDGVVQSGLGRKGMPFGWGWKELVRFILNKIEEKPDISAMDLAEEIVKEAVGNDEFISKDDITCGVIHCRSPRQLLIATGPPFDESRDEYLAYKIKKFQGRKIICGGTTANIVSNFFSRPLKVDLKSADSSLPPVAYMEGVDLVTEGAVTLARLMDCLDKYSLEDLRRICKDRNAVGMILHYILGSDVIEFIVGTRLNQAHFAPSQSVEIGVRRILVQKIQHLLEEKFLKDVSVEFV